MKNNPLGSIFQIGSIFDWITPSVGFIQDFINDPTLFQSNSWTFFIPIDEMTSSGWSMFSAENLMDKYGIKHWGSQVTNGQLFFSVRKDQALWAEYILLKYGIPIPESSMPPDGWMKDTKW